MERPDHGLKPTVLCTAECAKVSERIIHRSFDYVHFKTSVPIGAFSVVYQRKHLETSVAIGARYCSLSEQALC